MEQYDDGMRWSGNSDDDGMRQGRQQQLIHGDNSIPS